MPRTSITQTLSELETLAQAVTPEVTADVPYLERPHVKLQGLLEEIRKLLTRRDFYQARKQEATRKARARIRQARMTATLLRKGLVVHYGQNNEQLAAFAIQPFRGLEEVVKPQPSSYEQARDRAIARMRQGLPMGVGERPRWTRDELHER